MSRNKYPEKTQKLIIEVATKLFIEKGYDNTSLNDIVNNLGGLTKGAIYQHFSSKEEIYQAVVYQMSAKNDDELLELIENKDLNGLQKIKLAFVKSLDAAIENKGQMESVDYSKNPKMLYSLIKELKEEVSPMFIYPLIEQGISDGSIKTDYPKELSEMLAILINLWINPLVFKSSSEEILNKVLLLSEMMRGYNLNIIDEELIKKLKILSENGK